MHWIGKLNVWCFWHMNDNTGAIAKQVLFRFLILKTILFFKVCKIGHVFLIRSNNKVMFWSEVLTVLSHMRKTYMSFAKSDLFSQLFANFGLFSAVSMHNKMQVFKWVWLNNLNDFKVQFSDINLTKFWQYFIKILTKINESPGKITKPGIPARPCGRTHTCPHLPHIRALEHARISEGCALRGKLMRSATLARQAAHAPAQTTPACSPLVGACLHLARLSSDGKTWEWESWRPWAAS